MSQLNTRLSLREQIQVGLLLCCGVALVAVAAVAVNVLRPAPTVDGPAITLQAPVTEVDRDRAGAAITVRDAIDSIESAGLDLDDRGGHRGTGRGWFLRGDDTTYDESIADVLIRLGLIEPEQAHALDNTLVHQCGDWFAVLAPSTVLPLPADAKRWSESDCRGVESLVRDGPVFVVLSERAAKN